ncbi:MAG: hypothetical protein K6G17_06530 [Oscillospiraceae bacterium]|nr:hypothetical protein [Oscillospiraceae bacterium]
MDDFNNPAPNPPADDSAFTAGRHSAGAAGFLQKLDLKKIGIIAAALILVIVLIVVIAGSGNNKYAPVKALEKLANAKTMTREKYYSTLLNGVDKGNVSKIVKILSKGEDFKDDSEEWSESWKENFEEKQDEYGKNYKISYKNDKESEDKVDKDDLKSYKNTVKGVGDNYLAAAKELKKMKNSELKDLAEELDISVKDLKKLGEYMEAIGKALKKADISEAYELTVDTRITGKELDEPEEDDISLVVLKINGRWVSMNSIYLLRSLLGSIG